MNEPGTPITDAHPPITDALSEEWFAATSEGRLLIQRCSVCGENQFYPRRICRHCGSGAVEWLEASGRGSLHTFSVLYRTGSAEFAPFLPYVFAIVELEEGPRMTSNIVDVPHDELRCDMPVRVVFPTPGEGKRVFPCFTAA